MKEVSRAIIVLENGGVLLGKREHGIGAGEFALMGGKPEEGETAKAAVIREVAEEIGVDFDPTFFLEQIDNLSDPEIFWKVTYFTGPISGELVLNPREITEVITVFDADLDSLEIAFDHRDILRGYFESRENGS